MSQLNIDEMKTFFKIISLTEQAKNSISLVLCVS